MQELYVCYSLPAPRLVLHIMACFNIFLFLKIYIHEYYSIFISLRQEYERMIEKYKMSEAVENRKKIINGLR